jgi:hypothetical protein
MTKFRAFYAQRAGAEFQGSDVKWPIARDAWWDDQWFRFTGGGLARGVEITHKSKAGFVDLTFARTTVNDLEKVLTAASSRGTFPIFVKQTGYSASMRLQATKISDFSDLARADPIIVESLQQVKYLLSFYRDNESLLAEVVGRAEVPTMPVRKRNPPRKTDSR